LKGDLFGPKHYQSFWDFDCNIFVQCFFSTDVPFFAILLSFGVIQVFVVLQICGIVHFKRIFIFHFQGLILDFKCDIVQKFWNIEIWV